MSVSFVVEGADETARKLNRVIRLLEDDLTLLLSDAVTEVLNMARELVPVRTGRLQSSISIFDIGVREISLVPMLLMQVSLNMGLQGRDRNHT